MEMSARYRYLNRDGRWPDFTALGLELGADGALRLAALPAPDRALPDDLPLRPVPTGPAGLAIDCDGIVYWSEPDANSVWRLDRCADNPSPIPCAGGRGSAPTQFKSPRGLMIHRGQRRLYVADTGNHRVQIFDPRTWQLTGIWGGPQPGRFRSPLALAHDSAGNVYVADTGNHRVQKFDGHGDPAAFAAPDPAWQPSAVAVARDLDGQERVFVMDAQAATLRVLSTDGVVLLSTPLENPNPGLPHLQAPSGLAVADGGSVFVGDNDRLRIAKFQVDADHSLRLVGEAHYHGPVAALALDGCGGLLVLAGKGPPVRLVLDGACVTLGRLWGGPFPDPTLVIEASHRLKAVVRLPKKGGAAVRLFVRRDPAGAIANSPWEDCAKVQNLAALQQAAPPLKPGIAQGIWYQAPRGAPECLFPGAPGEQISVAVELSSDGEASPVLSQLRLDYQFEKLADRLPDCYFEENPNRGLVSRLVGVFASLFEDADTAIGRLPTQFDPWAAPAGALPRLAALVGLEPRNDVTADRVRRNIANAFARHAGRGTTAGIVAALCDELGVRAVVEEPICLGRVWLLADAGEQGDAPNGVGSILGATTMLPSAEPQGAIVGTTLILDQTEFIAGDEIGLPLFGDLAHRLVVWVPWRPGAGPEYLQSIRAVLDREVPCHLAYELCVAEPRLRVGIQARLGIDAVLGGYPDPAPLGAGLPGDGLVLGGDAPGRLGSARLGQTTYLGETTVDPPTSGESLP
jgi:phage tail-like protein